MLLEHGYEVELLAYRQASYLPPLPLQDTRLAVHFLPWDERAWSDHRRHAAFSAWVSLRCLCKRPDLLLAIDPEAAIASYPFAVLSRTSVVYFSLELKGWHPYPQFRGSPLRWGRQFLGALARNAYKRIECAAHRRAALTIIQDPNRAAVLQADNRLKVMPLVHVPPSLRTSFKPCRKPEYLAQKFRLSPEQVIILTAGGIADYYWVEEVARAGRDWPDHWVLVIHGPFRSGESYHDRVLRQCDGRKVIASTGMLEQAEFDAMVASAHIGLALYKDVGPNHFHITSGKVMQYLRCGVPVVATGFPNLREVVEKNRCGVCVSDPSGLSEAISSLWADYSTFRESAWRTFDEQFRFDIHFEKVLQRMDLLMAQTRRGQGRLPETERRL